MSPLNNVVHPVARIESEDRTQDLPDDPEDMIIYSRLRGKPARNYAEAFEYSFFGAYATDSEAYKIARIRAAYPPIYLQKLVQFFYRCNPEPNSFCIGKPATVTIELCGQCQNFGYALYGLVRLIEECQEMSTWPQIAMRMVVEVHCIPGVEVKWDDALPWTTPPPNVVFVQPHGFLEKTYSPFPVEDIDWTEVNCRVRDNYSASVVSVNLGAYDYELTKKIYVAKIVNKIPFERLLPDNTYLHWDDRMNLVADKEADSTMEIILEVVVADEQHVVEDAESVTSMLVEQDNGVSLPIR